MRLVLVTFHATNSAGLAAGLHFSMSLPGSPYYFGTRIASRVIRVQGRIQHR